MSDRYEDLKADERWELLYRTEYTLMIGRRLRRLRESQRLSQFKARHRARRPRGEPYSQSTLSRLEAGYANAPLYVYIHFAEGYGVDPGRLLGHAKVEDRVSDAEMTLIGFTRRLGIRPDEAIARLARAMARRGG
jgi:transcriptional regulator with XRE-family HTH domain